MYAVPSGFHLVLTKDIEPSYVMCLPFMKTMKTIRKMRPSW